MKKTAAEINATLRSRYCALTSEILKRYKESYYFSTAGDRYSSSAIYLLSFTLSGSVRFKISNTIPSHTIHILKSRFAIRLPVF